MAKKPQAVDLSPQEGKQRKAFDCESDIIIYGGSAGCLSGDTEYLCNGEWKPFKYYDEKDLVGVYNIDDNHISYEIPSKFIKEPCEEFYKFTHGYFTKIATPEHVFIYIDTTTGEHVVEFADEFVGRILDQEDKIIYFIDPFNPFPEYMNLRDIKVEPVSSEDGFKYCFDTSTGYIVVRNNGCSYVTGNSGKSRLLLIKACKKAYRDPNFEGVMFRRTTGPLRGAGGLFTEAKKLFRPLDVHVREKDMEIVFSGTKGGIIKFTHLEHENTAEANH